MGGSQKNPYGAYNQAAHTVAKTRQIVMLYDGMIRFLRQAKEAMHENRIEDRFNLLVKASNIALGLQSSLDFESGGDAAPVLFDFYSSVDTRIMDLHRTNSTSDTQQLIDDVKEMRELWNKIDSGEIADEDSNYVDDTRSGQSSQPVSTDETSGVTISA